ncbi:MAG: alpha/beta hydrolase [Acidobacteriota bacterium]
MNVLDLAISREDEGGVLAASVHLPNRLPAPVVVCCHGLMSSKESTKFVALCKAFCADGLAAVRFDFSGCGSSSPASTLNLIDARMRDLFRILDFISEVPWSNGWTGLLGSSLGGYLALLAAGSGHFSIGGLVCWATPFDLRRINLLSEETGVADTFRAALDSTDHPVELSGLAPVPGVLVIHGQRDETVAWTDALDLYRRVGEPKRLLLLEGADHRILDPDCRDLALRTSLEWFIERAVPQSGK